MKAALLPLAAPDPATDQSGEPVSDPRSAGARRWDALLTTAQHALDTDLPPDSHGAPARLLVTITLEALQVGLHHAPVTGVAGVGVTADGTELSAATIRRLACDADLIPVVLGGHGQPLDVGRSRYAVPPPIWNALVVRDRHCAFPGCDRPP